MIDFRKIVKDESKRRKISINKLALLAGVSRDSVPRWLNDPKASIHTDRLIRLIDFCGYRIVKKGK